MLNHNAIKEELKRGPIFVENGEQHIKDNSIEVTLGNTIKVYDFTKQDSLDVTRATPTIEYEIPEDGLILKPNQLYLARTEEYTKIYGLVPLLEGYDEFATMGMGIHVTAGFGDAGFEGTWTLEIECQEEVKIYPYMKIGKLCYHPLIGDDNILYRGKYFRQVDPTASRLSDEYQNISESNLNNSLTRKKSL